MEQRSADWFAARLGKVTASRVADVCARTKNGYGANRKNYMARACCRAHHWHSAGGIHQRCDAVGCGQRERGLHCVRGSTATRPIEEVGFVAHPSIADTGASPDGLVGADGLVEIKAPNTATHIETLLGAPIPEKYVLQMQWQIVPAPDGNGATSPATTRACRKR